MGNKAHRENIAGTPMGEIARQLLLFGGVPTEQPMITKLKDAAEPQRNPRNKDRMGGDTGHSITPAIYLNGKTSQDPRV